jgi:hypothetical protein
VVVDTGVGKVTNADVCDLDTEVVRPRIDDPSAWRAPCGEV